MRKLRRADRGWVAPLALRVRCGVTVGPHHTLSAPSVAHEIGRSWPRTTRSRRRPVTCPAGIQASKGTTFVCTTVFDGQQLDLDGTVTGSNGAVPGRAPGRHHPHPVLVQYLTDDIAQQTQVSPPTVDCGTKPVRRRRRRWDHHLLGHLPAGCRRPARSRRPSST